MASEFAEYVNSRLFVTVDLLETDQDEWGNTQPKQQSIEILTFLKQSRGSNSQPSVVSLNNEQGANSLRAYLKGYLVNPMQWPGNTRPTECEVEYYEKKGKLQVLSQFPRPFDTELLTGAIVEGWATFQV